MRLWHRCFLVNFTKFLRTPFLIEQLYLENTFGDCFYTFPALKVFFLHSPLFLFLSQVWKYFRNRSSFLLLWRCEIITRFNRQSVFFSPNVSSEPFLNSSAISVLLFVFNSFWYLSSICLESKPWNCSIILPTPWSNSLSSADAILVAFSSWLVFLLNFFLVIFNGLSLSPITYFKTMFLNLVKAFSNTLPDLPTLWRAMSMKQTTEQEDFSYQGKFVTFSPQHWFPKHEKDISVFTTRLELLFIGCKRY